MDIETRVRLYTQNLKPAVVHYSELPLDNRPMIYGYNTYKHKPFPQKDKMYYHDMTRFIHYLPALHQSTFLFCPKDRVEPFSVPTLVKTRPLLEMGSSILMNLNTARHFEHVFTIDELDVDYSQKSNKLVWRGADTGYGFGNNIPSRECSRETLVRQFASHSNKNMDIGLSLTDANKHGVIPAEELFFLMKPKLSIHELLQHKFLLSVEGNDVATNLKWILYSNSVPFCPPFTIQSWILEDNLQPWQHYIPVRADFSDMEEKLDWAIHHPSQCKSIARQGKDYMRQFMDLEKENTIVEHVLSEYVNQVKVVIS